MCDVKPDPDNPQICRGCLSTNRKLSTVANLDLYSLLREDQKMEVLSVPHITLCWECHALLQRTRRFLVQVQKAHDILQDSLPLSPTKPTLSLLTFHKQNKYDAVFEESIPPEQPLFSETKNLAENNEKVIIPTKFKAESSAKNEQIGKTQYFSDDSEDYENVDNDEDNYCPSEDNIEIKVTNYSLPLFNYEKQKYVALTKDAKQDTPKPVKRKVKNNKTKPEETPTNKWKLPLTKSPAVLKLEMELKKLIQLNAFAPKNPSKELKRKRIEKHSVYDENKETNPANNDECKTTKHQKSTEFKDPDFTLEENDEDYATDDSEEFKGVPLKKTKRQPDESPNSDVEDNDNNTMDKNRKFHKTTKHYENIVDIFPYFTKTEMSQEDLKRVLDEDDAIVDKKKPFKCNICGRRFTKRGYVKTHAIRNHKKEYPNNFHKGGFQNPPLVVPEKFVWQCHICNRTMRQEHIVTHMNEYHRLQYTCNIDGCEWWKDHFCFRNKEDFDQHYESIHKKHICDLCQKSHKNKMLLATHIQEAHACAAKPTSFTCRYCPKVYKKYKSLKNHEYSSHGPPEPEELRYCVECNITFKRAVIFEKHFKNLHSGLPKPTWTCEKCGKVLNSKDTYLGHLDVIHGGQTKHRCHICGKFYAKKQTLQTHLDRHNNIPLPKNKPCPVCGRRFHSNRVLRFHMYTHTGERPYQCPHCEVAYSQPHCLVLHLKKRHNKDATVRINGTIVPATATSETKTAEQ